MYWIYQVEMFVNVGTEDDPVYDWVTDWRHYHAERNLSDDDLKPIEGRRRNIKFIGTSDKLEKQTH